MTNKNFYFLAGMYRSGNTVLSSVLNQNPEVYVSPLSIVSEFMWNMHFAAYNSQVGQTSSNPSRNHRTISSILPTYYKDIDKSIIFDREKYWARPANFKMILDYITKDPKIVFTVRPMVEVLASQIAIMPEIILSDMKRDGWPYRTFLSEYDNMCDYLMAPGSGLHKFLDSYDTIKNPNYTHMFHIVEYKDLLSSPEKTLSNIYDFIGLEHFAHDFNNIELKEKPRDVEVGLPSKLHEVRKKISASNIKPEDYLSDYAMTKYSKMDFWKI